MVDADLSQYFDTIPHAELIECVARRISDRWVLKLIKMWLKAPVEERDGNGKRRMRGGKRAKRGTPQGGSLSPLLANLCLNGLMKHWRRQGKGNELRAVVVTYADDFVILSCGKAGEALEWSERVLTRIGLKLNPAKTKLVDAKTEHFDFLGYTFGPHRFRKDGHWYLGARPSKKSVQRLKQKLRELLRPSNVGTWDEARDRLNRSLRGWSNYFAYGPRMPAYRAVDNFVAERVRGFSQRRHKGAVARHASI